MRTVLFTFVVGAALSACSLYREDQSTLSVTAPDAGSSCGSGAGLDGGTPCADDGGAPEDGGLAPDGGSTGVDGGSAGWDGGSTGVDAGPGWDGGSHGPDGGAFDGGIAPIAPATSREHAASATSIR